MWVAGGRRVVVEMITEDNDINGKAQLLPMPATILVDRRNQINEKINTR